MDQNIQASISTSDLFRIIEGDATVYSSDLKNVAMSLMALRVRAAMFDLGPPTDPTAATALGMIPGHSPQAVLVPVQPPKA